MCGGPDVRGERKEGVALPLEPMPGWAQGQAALFWAPSAAAPPLRGPGCLCCDCRPLIFEYGGAPATQRCLPGVVL